MLDPFAHAEHVTGRRQIGLVDAWTTSGVAVAISEVTGPHRYEFGSVAVPTVAVTLYGVRRHVLTVNGRVRRDGRVVPGRFRIGQPGQDIVVDAVPAAASGKLLLIYLGPHLLTRVADETGRQGPVELLDRAWDTEDPFLHVAARRLVETIEYRQPVERLLADQVALTLALHLLDRHAAVPAPAARLPGLPPAALSRVTEFIRADPAAHCSIAVLAALSGLSPSHFLRKFQAATGMTPLRFVVQERVAQAQHLLARTDMPGCEVALACGFSSQSHLGTAFRSATGLTPRQYRRDTRGT